MSNLKLFFIMGFKTFLLEILHVAKQLPLIGKIMLGAAFATLPFVFSPPVEKAVFGCYEYNSVIEKNGELCFYLGSGFVAKEDVPDEYFNHDGVPMAGDNVVLIQLSNHNQRVFIGKHRFNEPFENYFEDINDLLKREKRGWFLGAFALTLGGALMTFPGVYRKIMNFISMLLEKIK